MPLTPAAERQRQCRQRKRAGLRRVVVDLDEAMLEVALIDRGFLARGDSDDPAKVADALRALVEQWIAPPAMPD